MNITVNGKKKQGWLWDILAVIITVIALIWSLMVVALVFIFIASPIWLPIAMILLLTR